MDLNVQGDLVTSNPLMFRNRIINGDCSVAQRGNVAVSSNTTAYGGCDRIAIQTSGFTTVSGTIAQAGTVGSGTSSSGYVQQFGGVTTTGSGTIAFIQRIEAINCADLNSKTVTISLTLYQDTGSTLSPTINLYKPNALDNWSASTFLQGTAVSLPTTSRTRFTFTATLGATDASNGLAVQVVFPVGAVSSKFFQISDIQLELGSSATPFERRPIGMELQLCQRYYEKSYHHTVAPGTLNADGVNMGCHMGLDAINTFGRTISFSVTKAKSNPIITFYRANAAGSTWLWYTASSSNYDTPLVTATGSTGFCVRFGGGNLSTSRGATVHSEGHWTVDAEL